MQVLSGKRCFSFEVYSSLKKYNSLQIGEVPDNVLQDLGNLEWNVDFPESSTSEPLSTENTDKNDPKVCILL